MYSLSWARSSEGRLSRNQEWEMASSSVILVDGIGSNIFCIKFLATVMLISFQPFPQYHRRKDETSVFLYSWYIPFYSSPINPCNLQLQMAVFLSNYLNPLTTVQNLWPLPDKHDDASAVEISTEIVGLIIEDFRSHIAGSTTSFNDVPFMVIGTQPKINQFQVHLAGFGVFIE